MKTIETLEEALKRLRDCFAEDNLQRYIGSPTKEQMDAVNRMLEKARLIQELQQDSTTWNQGEVERANACLEETRKSLTKVRGWSKRTSKSAQELSIPVLQWLEEFLKSKIQAYKGHRARRLAELSSKKFKDWTPEDDTTLERFALSNKTDGSGNFETVIDPNVLALYQARVAYLQKEDNVSDNDDKDNKKPGITQVIGTGDAFTPLPVKTAEPVVGGPPANDTSDQTDEEPSSEENHVVTTLAVETIAKNLAKLPSEQWGDSDLRTAVEVIGFRDKNGGYSPKPGHEDLYKVFVEAYTRIRGYAPLTAEEAARAAELDQREVYDLSPDDVLFVMNVIGHKKGAKGGYGGLLAKAVSAERHFERINAILAKESASDWHHEDLRLAQMCCARKGADGQPHPWLETLGRQLEAALKARNEALGNFADEEKTPFVNLNAVGMLTRWLGITNRFDETRDPPARDKDPVGFAAYNRWHAFVINRKADPLTVHEYLWTTRAIEENLVGPVTKRALKERLSRGADPPNTSPVVTATTAGPNLPPTRMGGSPVTQAPPLPNLRAFADANKTAFAPTEVTTAKRPNNPGGVKWERIGEPAQNTEEAHSDSSPSVRKRTLLSRARSMSTWQKLFAAVMLVGIVFFLLGRYDIFSSNNTPSVESTDGDAAIPTVAEDASAPAPVIAPPLPISPTPPAPSPAVRPPAPQQPSATWPPPGSHPLTPRDVGARNLSSVDWGSVYRFFAHVHCRKIMRPVENGRHFDLTDSDCIWIP